MKIRVVSSEEVKGDGGAKIHLGAGLQEKGIEQSENYIKFTIPVSFPVSDKGV